MKILIYREISNQRGDREVSICEDLFANFVARAVRSYKEKINFYFINLFNTIFKNV